MTLKPKQKQAIALLAEGKTKKETAKEVGIALSTLYSWVGNEPEFSAELNVVAQRRFEDLLAFSLSKAHDCLEELYAIGMDKDASNRDRISALRQILGSVNDFKANLSHQRDIAIERDITILELEHEAFKK